MKATGIVRRIDDLGRVVIPKEIRRTMRIREGDPLEIFTNKDGEVIFKKYSPIGELADHVTVYADIINKATGNTVAIVDKDLVIATAGLYKRELMDRKISADIEKLLEKRHMYIYKIGDKRLNVVDGLDKCHAGLVSPIVVDGDVIGGIIVLIGEMGNAPNETETKVLATTTQLLEKQLEL